MDEILIKEDFIKEYCKNCGTQMCEGVDSDWFSGCKYKKYLYNDGCKDLFYTNGEPAFCPFTGRQCKTLCVLSTKVGKKEYRCALANKDTLLLTRDFFGFFTHKNFGKQIDMMKRQWSSEC